MKHGYKNKNLIQTKETRRHENRVGNKHVSIKQESNSLHMNIRSAFFLNYQRETTQLKLFKQLKLFAIVCDCTIWDGMNTNDSARMNGQTHIFPWRRHLAAKFHENPSRGVKIGLGTKLSTLYNSIWHLSSKCGLHLDAKEAMHTHLRIYPW